MEYNKLHIHNQYPSISQNQRPEELLKLFYLSIILLNDITIYSKMKEKIKRAAPPKERSNHKIHYQISRHYQPVG